MKKKKGNLKDYRIIRKVFEQPLDHADPDGPKLDQHVDILIPEGTPPDSPVFFNLGNEQDLKDEHLTELYERHGDGYPIIYVQAEHRGYGQSLSRDEDQTVPSYVRMDQALADAHVVVTQLKKDYPGPWMAAGWSYGGGLVINFAFEYPDDVDVILCSSGVVDWPMLNTAYEQQVKEAFSDGAYRRLIQHSKNLAPAEMFDENWLRRKFLHAIIKGLAQKAELKKLLPYFELFTRLPTGILLKLLRWMDNAFAEGEAWQYALSISKKTLTREEAATGKHGWRSWRYQQCAETGVYFSSEGDDMLFTRTADEIRAETRALFGMDPPYGESPTWSPRKMLEELTVPMVYVAGGRDPWFALGIEPDYEIRSGRYFHVPEGQHCPDRDDPELARQVLDEMLKHATGDS